MASKREIVLQQPVLAYYDTEGGQRGDITIPAGTKILVPLSWIFNGLPTQFEAKAVQL